MCNTQVLRSSQILISVFKAFKAFQSSAEIWTLSELCPGPNFRLNQSLLEQERTKNHKPKNAKRRMVRMVGNYQWKIWSGCHETRGLNPCDNARWRSSFLSTPSWHKPSASWVSHVQWQISSPNGSQRPVLQNNQIIIYITLE